MTTQLELGERLKQQGQVQVIEGDEDWMDGAIIAIGHYAAMPRNFTVEDIRRFYVTQPQSPNGWGAAFSAAAKQGIIRRVGYAKNTLPSAHARTVSVWQGVKESVRPDSDRQAIAKSL